MSKRIKYTDEPIRAEVVRDFLPPPDQLVLGEEGVKVSTEENKALIRDWLKMADAGFTGDFDRFFAPNYMGHVSGRIHQSLEELKAQERAAAQAFSKATRTIEDLLAIEDKVVLRLAIRAKHTGTFQGISATGRDIVFTGIVIYRIADGRIVESWGEIDFAGLWRQLTSAASA